MTLLVIANIHIETSIAQLQKNSMTNRRIAYAKERLSKRLGDYPLDVIGGGSGSADKCFLRQIVRAVTTTIKKGAHNIIEYHI